jgi:uncharacterized protein
LIFREGVGRTRGEIGEEVDALVGEGLATLAHRGLAKVLEDRAEFEVVADLPPEQVRQSVFLAAAKLREELLAGGRRVPFRRENALERAGLELDMPAEKVEAALFADLKDENRMLSFKDVSAKKLVERYNVALAQAVLLRSVRIDLELKAETPARYRQIFRWLKFHRLLYNVGGSTEDGFVFHVDGPLSLFSATNRYGFQIALFLPAVLLCRNYRLDAELRWGPAREPRTFHLEPVDGLVSHFQDFGVYTPPEIKAFVDRFRQVAPAWEVDEASEFFELGNEGMWVPDYRLRRKSDGQTFYLDVVGFWKRGSLERLLRLLPRFGPPGYILAISEKLKVDEDAELEFAGPILKFKDVPNALELARLLDAFSSASPPLSAPED